MPYFRLYVLNEKNRVVRSSDLTAPHRLAAIDAAIVLLAEREAPWFAFELWQNARQVHKVLHSEVDTGAAPAPQTVRSVTTLRTPPAA